MLGNDKSALIKFTVIKRPKDDLIWCPISRKWVDKRTDTAHFCHIRWAEEALKEVPKEDGPELLSMDYADAEGVYFDHYASGDELEDAIMRLPD